MPLIRCTPRALPYGVLTIISDQSSSTSVAATAATASVSTGETWAARAVAGPSLSMVTAASSLMAGASRISALGGDPGAADDSDGETVVVVVVVVVVLVDPVWLVASRRLRW